MWWCYIFFVLASNLVGVRMGLDNHDTKRRESMGWIVNVTFLLAG